MYCPHCDEEIDLREEQIREFDIDVLIDHIRTQDKVSYVDVSRYSNYVVVSTREDNILQGSGEHLILIIKK